MKRILAINPGATSTKIAVFEDEMAVFKKTVEHQGPEMNDFKRVIDQVQFRTDLILGELKQAGIGLDSLDAIVGRGGLMKPIPGGTYAVNEAMLEDLKKAERGEHASNLGGVLAYNLASARGIPSFIVDPVVVDELEPVARVSGSPEFQRISMCHALNMKAVARKVAAELGKSYQEANLIVVHMGTGISMSVHYGGRMIDMIDGRDEGTFAADRCGGLPASQLVKLCYSGKYTYDEMMNRLFRSGGFCAYLGTRDAREIERRAAEGDSRAELILQALCYQVAKGIGSLATVLKGKVERIVLTGGMAHSKRLTADITERVSFIAPVTLVPGEEELESLVAGAVRVLNGEENAQIYQ